MKRNAFLITVLVLLLALILTGCAAVGNQAGSVGIDEEAVELQDGQFTLYINENCEGVFTFALQKNELELGTAEGEEIHALQENSWTIRTAEGEYVALNPVDGSVGHSAEPFAWAFDGAFSAVFGESTVYLGSGLTAVADKPNTTFTRPTESASTPEPTSNPAEGVAASVTTNGTTTYYATFAEAWSAVNANTGAAATVTLLDNVSGAKGDFDGVGELEMEERTASLTLDLNNYTIDRGLTASTACGAVFNLQNKGTLTIKNGTVTGGNCDGDGGCFYVGNAGLDLSLENLTIAGNHTTGNGSAIYLAAVRTKVTLNNVNITDNNADQSGAVFWAISDINRAILTIKNTVKISGNSGSGSLNNLVYDGHGWCGWLNTDNMATDSSIGVSYSDGYGGPLADSFGTRVDTLKSCFFVDQGDHEIVKYGSTLLLKFKDHVAAILINGEWQLFNSFAQALGTANSYGDYNITLALLQDIGPEEMSDVGRIAISERTQPLTLDLNNHTINRGLTTPTDYGAVFNLQEKGTVVIKNGTVTGGNCSGDGGCFYIGNEGLDLTLENLTITGNHAAGTGSAIYLAATKTKVTLDNVSITGNNADKSGAVFWAIYETYRASLVFKNKVEISGNSGSGSLNNLVYDGKGWCCWLNTDNMATTSKIGVSYFDGYGGPLADSFGSRLNELKSCFFADQGDHDIVSGNGTLVVKFKTDKAAVIHNGNWSLFNSFAQTWASANAYLLSKDATMILFGDWVANEKSGFDDTGTYGNTEFFVAGALQTRRRSDHSWLILDLNGHTIDARDNNRIFVTGNIKVAIKNGCLQNGGNVEYGGAIYIKNRDDSQLDLQNLTIRYCTSDFNGSAIYVVGAESINFDTVTIEYNNVAYAVHSYASAVYLKKCDVRMKGKMVIRNNSSSKLSAYGQSNLFLESRIDELGDPDTNMSGSEIHLTWILKGTSLRSGYDRQITEKSVCSKASAASLFKIDQELRDDGFDTVALYKDYGALMLEDH